MKENRKSKGISTLPSPSECVELYTKMLLVRRFEEKAGQLYGMGMIAGFCHLYIGQEAVVVGIQSRLAKGDSVVTSYRCHGHLLAAGSDPGVVMAELMGRVDGCSKGKGGSMHMFDVANNFYGGHGIVAAQVPIGTGLAFAHKYNGDGNISVVYYGDGAANQGQVFESFNMASLWKLPVLYVVENNEYAMGTSVARASASIDFYRRGEAFGIAGVQVNGMNVLAVSEAVEKAMSYVRSGNGPMLMEVKTYRYRGHSMSDPATYRTKEEVNEVKGTRDPINSLKELLLAKKYLTEEGLKDLEKEVKIRIDNAVKFAEASPEPDAGELYKDVYVLGE
jgi:pyruvate dehydrogenase E1 component alpha subunit